MAHIEQAPVLMKANDGRVNTGAWHITLYDERDRRVRALKALGVCWVAAPLLFFTFVPIVHLLVSAGAFLAGPVVAYARYNVPRGSEKLTGRCPVCNREITIALEPKESVPMWKYCPLCNAPLHVMQPG
jgi:hypothetical protein